MLGRHSTVGCCSFECSLSCDKTELCSHPDEQRGAEKALLGVECGAGKELFHEGLMSAKSVPYRGLPRATLPVLLCHSSSLVSAWLQRCRDGLCALPH